MNNEEELVTTGEYTKLFITANTLVPKGAVQEKGIYKSKDGIIKSKLNNIITKADDEKMQLHSICYMLNKKDSHGNFVSNPKVLEDACTDFMINGNKIIKHTHEGKEIDASVQQLYIVPKNHPLWKEEKYVGAIANVIQFKNAELYKYYKENDFETSIEGEAEEAVVPVENTNLFKKLFKLITNQLKIEGIIPMGNVDEVKKAEDTTDAKTDETVKPEDTKTEEVKKEIDPMIVEFIKTVADEINAKFDAKYDELKKMIEEMKNGNAEEITELKKSIGKSKQADTDVNKDVVIVKKSLLS